MNDEPLPKDAPLPQEEQQIQPDHFGGGVQGGAPVSVAHFSLMKIVGLVVAAAVVLGGIAAFIFYRSSSPVLIDESGVRTESDNSRGSLNTNPVLPASFPSDIPIYPGAELIRATPALKTTIGTREIYAWLVPEPVDVVFSWYVTEFENFGWEISLDFLQEDGGILTVRKGERKLEVPFSMNAGRVEVGVLIVK